MTIWKYVTDERYKFIQKVVGTAVKKSGEKLTVSDKIDQIVTNRFLGIPYLYAGNVDRILHLCKLQ